MGEYPEFSSVSTLLLWFFEVIMVTEPADGSHTQKLFVGADVFNLNLILCCAHVKGEQPSLKFGIMAL